MSNSKFEHKGVAYYDRERLRRQLPLIFPTTSGEKRAKPPSWVKLPKSWGRWKPVYANHFHSIDGFSNPATDDKEAYAESSDYVLEPCERSETVIYDSTCGFWDRCPWPREQRTETVIYKYRLRFTNGPTFYFINKHVAEQALDELLKIRKAKHPRLKLGKMSGKNEAVFFTHRKLA